MPKNYNSPQKWIFSLLGAVVFLEGTLETTPVIAPMDLITLLLIRLYMLPRNT